MGASHHNYQAVGKFKPSSHSFKYTGESFLCFLNRPKWRKEKGSQPDVREPGEPGGRGTGALFPHSPKHYALASDHAPVLRKLLSSSDNLISWGSTAETQERRYSAGT